MARSYWSTESVEAGSLQENRDSPAEQREGCYSGSQKVNASLQGRARRMKAIEKQLDKAGRHQSEF